MIATMVFRATLMVIAASRPATDDGLVAHYRFDEGDVRDYYLQFEQTEIQDSLDSEAYPKAGAPNPVVDLFVYDLASGRSTRMDVRDGKPFTDDSIGMALATRDLLTDLRSDRSRSHPCGRNGRRAECRR